VLAAPLVMLSCAVGLRVLLPTAARGPRTAVAGRPRGRPVLVLAVAGALGASALLVKQNFVDALVLLGVLLAVRTARRELPWRRGLVLAGALVAGAAVPLLLTLVWAAAWGSGPTGLWEPVFAFRSASLRVITDESATAPARRAAILALVAVASGLALVLALFVLTSLRRLRRAEPLAVAVTAMLLAATPSIALGGSFWVHYLLELVPAAALSTALLAGRGVGVRRCTAAVLAVVVASSLAVTAVRAPAAREQGCARVASGAAEVASWLRARAEPGDTVVTLYGGADTVLGSGLEPAYPYLWSLPVRTLDPDLVRLTATLSGPAPATWVVRTLPLHSWGLDPQHRVQDALAQDYQPAGRVCGHPVYLQRGLSRPDHG
jgi:hypothetical protein